MLCKGTSLERQSNGSRNVKLKVQGTLFFILWLFNVLGNHVSGRILQRGSDFSRYTISTFHLEVFTALEKKWYINDYLVLPQFVLDQFHIMMLAVLFMRAGSFHGNQLRISSGKWSIEDRNRLAQAISNVLDIGTTVSAKKIVIKDRKAAILKLLPYMLSSELHRLGKLH
jgi:hypothetical protein